MQHNNKGNDMTPTMKSLTLFFSALMLANAAYALSPRDDLRQMVEQLQKTPNDNALREKIIKLAPTLKPAPAVPDTAVAFEGRAQFAFRSAKSEGDFLAAAQEYEKAVAAAPWVPGYYADLCTIYEKAGKFEDAKRHCGFYLIGLTDPTQMTDVKRRIAGLEFGIEKAKKENSPEARAAKEREAEQRFIASLEGAKYICPETETSFYTDNSADIKNRVELEIKNGKLKGASVTTWISPRGLRDMAGGRNHVGFRAFVGWEEVPIHERVVVFKDRFGGTQRVEIYDNRLVVGYTYKGEQFPDKTCSRQ